MVDQPKHILESSSSISPEEKLQNDKIDSIADKYYRQGFEDALRLYAVWNNGKQTVGCGMRSLQWAIDNMPKNAPRHTD